MRDFYGRECECAACNLERQRQEMRDKEWLEKLREWAKEHYAAPQHPEEPT